MILIPVPVPTKKIRYRPMTKVAGMVMRPAETEMPAVPAAFVKRSQTGRWTVRRGQKRRLNIFDKVWQPDEFKGHGNIFMRSLRNVKMFVMSYLHPWFKSLRIRQSWRLPVHRQDRKRKHSIRLLQNALPVWSKNLLMKMIKRRP